MKIIRDANLKEYNSFGIDACASKIILVQSEEDIIRYLNSESYTEQDCIIGSGSNILLLGDVKQNIIKNDIKSFRLLEDAEEDVVIEVGAGVVWHDFLLECLKNGYYGLENLALIPGTVGAAPVQNIGAYGIEQESCFVSLRGILKDTAESMTFTKNKCKFSYRSSIFKTSLRGRFIITHVRYKLRKKFRPILKYKDLIEKFSNKENFLPTELFDYICEVRQGKTSGLQSIGQCRQFL